MAYTIRGELSGLEQVVGKLTRLRQGARNKILRKGLDQGTKPVLASAKGKTPRGTGLLKRSMTRKVKVYGANANAVGLVGPRTRLKGVVNITLADGSTKTRTVDPVRYSHLVEGGRKAVRAAAGKALMGIALGRVTRAGAVQRTTLTNRAGKSRVTTTHQLRGAGSAWYAKSVRPARGQHFLASAWSASKSQAAEDTRAAIEDAITKEVTGGG